MNDRFPRVSDWARRACSESGLWDGRLLDGYLEEFARSSPDRLAVVDGATRLSYADLLDQVSRISAGLRRLGVGPGDVVAMRLPNWWEALAVHYAVLRLGAVSNPVMSILRERDLAYVLSRGGAKVLVSAAEHRGFDHGALGVLLAGQLPDLAHVVTVRGSRDGALDFAELTAKADGERRSPVGAPMIRWCCSTPRAPSRVPRVRCTPTTRWVMRTAP